MEVAAAAPPPPPPPPPPIEENLREIFVVVEEMPTFPGCEDEVDRKFRKACADQKLMQYLADNIRYPSNAIDNGIQGSVIIQFVIEKDGSITNIDVLRDIGGGCGDEARRLVESMNKSHKWHPGKQRGKPVAVMFTLPVRFKLQYN
jgi:protein TonB